jgi:hypothetical protein
MSEHENQWTAASAENGAFDPEKAKRLTDDAVAQYQTGLRTVERTTWLYLALCVVVFVFAYGRFQFASSTKAIVGFGIVMLIAYESTVLMKLWYWIAGTKLVLLREIKQLQLQASTTTASADTGGRGRRSLSRWERIAWFVGLAVAACTVSTLTHHSASDTITLGECVTIKPDGAASTMMKVESQVTGEGPVGSFSFFVGCERAEKQKFHFRDELGRELPFEATTEEHGGKHYTVRMLEPVMPGQWLRYTQISENPAAAAKQGDRWTYLGDYTYGCRNNEYFVTVELPRGAEVVSADPKPAVQTVDNGGMPYVVFRATKGCSERFRYEVQYRLAGK